MVNFSNLSFYYFIFISFKFNFNDFKNNKMFFNTFIMYFYRNEVNYILKISFVLVIISYIFIS